MKNRLCSVLILISFFLPISSFSENPFKTKELNFSLFFKENENDPNYQFNRVSYVCFDKNGLLYIPSNSDSCIKVFDHNAKYLKTIGKQGNGPGEFMYLFNLRITDKELLVTDANMNRHHFDLTHNYKKTINSGIRGIFIKDDYYLVFDADWDAKKLMSSVINKKTKKELIISTIHKTQTMIKQNKKNFFLSMTGSTQLLYTVLPNGSLAYGETDKPEIYLYNEEKIKRIIKENFERKRLSEKELKTSQERIEKILKFSNMKGNIQVHEFHASFLSLSSDENNNIWVHYRKTDADYLYGYTEEGKNIAIYKLNYSPDGKDTSHYIQVMGGIAFYSEYDDDKGLMVFTADLK